MPSVYLQNPWAPVPHQIIRDQGLRRLIHEKGYAVVPLRDTSIVIRLQHLYEKHHRISAPEGGMFYSIYSQNLEYRRKMHVEIGVLIGSWVNDICIDFKMMLNAFVVKMPGPKSEFYLHQDTTGLDEWNYSPLSIWIPLQDVDEINGCLGIIPYSHHFFSPYRSISFPAPFDHIQAVVKQYIQKLPMKVGEALVFDSRILHLSFANQSSSVRVAAVCGLFPAEATLITCHKPTYVCGGKVELIAHDDEFLLTGKNFLIDCQKRPESGRCIGWVDDPYLPISLEEFETLCRRYQLVKTSKQAVAPTECAMIGEPG